MPSVSVIIPLKDRVELLEATLDSLRAQTLTDFEALICDNGSTAESIERVRSLIAGDSRFQLLTAPITGAPAARNLGARSASSDLVIFLDSDDLLAPTCLEQRVRFMQDRPALDFAVYDCALFNDVPGDASLRWNVDKPVDDLDRLLAGDVPWQTTGPIWRQSALVKFDPWDEQCLAGQDWEFHIRALAAGLKYEKTGVIDFYWRQPGSRQSVSQLSAQPDRIRARPGLLERLVRAVERAGALTESRKRAFAGLFFAAARQTADKISRTESRNVWKRARDLSLVSGSAYRQGWRYFAFWKFPSLQQRQLRKIEKSWPPEMLPRKSATFLKAPLDPDRAPAISVLMCVYNGQEYLASAIESILRQTFRDFEFVIVDDGSTDRSKQIVERYAAEDLRIKLISRANTGLARALNDGLSACRGEFIARMDADDIALPVRFATQIAHLRAHSDCVIVGANVQLIDPNDLPIGLLEHRQSHEQIDAELLRGSGGALCHPVTMMRRAAVEQVGRYREHYNNSEDLDLFLRLAEVGRCANLPDVLLNYRRHLESVSHQKYENQWKLKKQIVGEAYARRGKTMPEDWTFTPWQPKPKGQQMRVWGWAALKAGRRKAARKLAWSALKLEPLTGANWKLWICALRGR
ncbi:MAG TPA: glycosyltransferase family 2 protein [Tepidisphaeraceae bacterium]|nr:glycosyltransferase family 2 protein [Tepidisphaeraceae bacterium]